MIATVIAIIAQMEIASSKYIVIIWPCATWTIESLANDGRYVAQVTRDVIESVGWARLTYLRAWCLHRASGLSGSQCTLFLINFFGIQMVLCDLYLKRFGKGFVI